MGRGRMGNPGMGGGNEGHTERMDEGVPEIEVVRGKVPLVGFLSPRCISGGENPGTAVRGSVIS